MSLPTVPKPALPPMSIRPVSPSCDEDLDQLVRIENAAHLAGRTAWTRQGFEAELDKSYSRVWVLTDDETDERVFAFIVFWVMGEDAEVLDVVVDPQWRRRGLGTLLLRKAIADSMRSGAVRMRLNVRKSNTPAIELYQRLRFTITHIRERFYSNGEAAYEMELPFEGSEIADF